MHAAGLRASPVSACGRCRHVASAAQHRHPVAPRRVVAVRATLPAQGEDQVASQALQEYFELERTGSMTALTVENLRLKYGIRRGVDGRVQLKKSDGKWMQIKLDMELQGTMLLRDTTTDEIYVLQTDTLQQIDLSDDYLLMMLFSDGSWQEDIQPIRLGDAEEGYEDLKLPEQQFKDLVGMIKTLQDMEKESLQGYRQEAQEVDATVEPLDGN
eukprot:GHRR01007746.1.p1 GENE.GHRR01007746.1~~GHRR01007746.1.p1  ORF type:complete len:214 (+),score=66.25 GHRR01007746.1:390-1031(+)